MSLGKISLFTLGCILLLSLNKCNSKEDIKENAKETISTSNNTLEKKVDLKTINIPLETIRDNKYLLKNIAGRPNLQNEEYLRDKINKYFKSFEHTCSKKDSAILPIYDVKELSLCQLQRIYLLYEYLKDYSSLQEIGKLIEDYVLDIYAEHGGIVIFNKKKINFKTLESYVKRDTANNDIYGAPDETSILEKIGEFHLHATSENEKEYANPGHKDLIISYFTIHVNNESHDFLITPLDKWTFNIDYYGGHKEINPVVKVFDIGNYTYNTPKIFK